MTERKFTHPRDAGPDHPGYVTRDGRPARIVCTDAKGAYPVVALVIEGNGTEWAYSFTQDGWLHRSDQPCTADLLDAPKPKRSGVYERWVIVAPDHERTFFSEEAWRDQFRSNDLARFVVQHHWEEGEGL